MIAGGAEASICRIGYAGFIACRAVSTGFNDNAGAGLRVPMTRTAMAS